MLKMKLWTIAVVGLIFSYQLGCQNRDRPTINHSSTPNQEDRSEDADSGQAPEGTESSDTKKKERESTPAGDNDAPGTEEPGDDNHTQANHGDQSRFSLIESLAGGKWELDCSVGALNLMAGIPTNVEYAYLSFSENKIYWKAVFIDESEACTPKLASEAESYSEKIFEVHKIYPFAGKGKENTYHIDYIEKGSVDNPLTERYESFMTIQVNPDFISVWESDQDPNKHTPRNFVKVIR